MSAPSTLHPTTSLVTGPSGPPAPAAPVPASPLLRRVPPCEPAHEHASRQVQSLPATRTSSPSPAARPLPPPTPVAPAALVRAQQVFRLAFEVLEGRRGPHQLQPLMTPDIVAKITTMARGSAGRRTPRTARLHRVHVQQVTPRAAEACVSVERDGRVRSVAARLELAKDGWRCTALLFG